ncbi:MAG: DUF2946 family protein [Betaproteobacteria bacterium]
MHALLTLLRPSLATRRLGALLALFALLVAAAVPTFSRLLQPVGLADWAILCQSTPATPAGAPDALHGDACALCTLAHTTPAMAGAAPATFGELAYTPPTPPTAAPVRTRVAQARAPGARAPPAQV